MERRYPLELEIRDIKNESRAKVRDEHGAIFSDIFTYGSSCEPYVIPIERSSNKTEFLFFVGEDYCNFKTKDAYQILYNRMLKHGKER